MKGFGTAVDEVRHLSLAKEAGNLLEKQYPGWAWSVHVDPRGFLNVFSLRLGGMGQWGFRIKTSDLATDPTLKGVVRAGGEILERWNKRRRRYQPGEGVRMGETHQLVGTELGAKRKVLVI